MIIDRDLRDINCAFFSFKYMEEEKDKSPLFFRNRFQLNIRMHQI